MSTTIVHVIHLHSVRRLEFSRACHFRAFQAFRLLRILSGFSGWASGFSIVVKYANLKLRMQSNFPHQTTVDTYEMTYYFFLLARKYEFTMILVKSSLQDIMKSELLIDMEISNNARHKCTRYIGPFTTNPVGVSCERPLYLVHLCK